jgi:S-DNA-T family DNA segregation ATPase FtsK/SpoIIIE
MGKKKKDNNLDYLSVPKLNLDERAKRSLGIVAVFAFGLISLLGLFNLSGVVGIFLSKWLTLIFGFGRWLVPLVFLFWGMLLVRNEKYEIKTSDYIGLVILFISYQTLFHFFISESEWKSTVAAGIGGGYLGLWFSQFFNYLFGFWGGVIILLCLFLVSLVIVFNTSLSKIIGHESFLAVIFRPIGKLFSIAFSPSEETEGKPNRKKAKEFIDEAREEILGSWTKKEVTAEISEEEEEEIAEEVTAAVLKKDVPKIQEKIAWPKKQIKIDIPVDLLNHKVGQAIGGDTNANGLRIKKTLENFGIPVEMGETKVGPTVTQYTFKPAEGVKLSKITTLSNDLSLALAAHPIRIEAPIPGQSLVGIEVPNKTKAIVGLREILEDNVFKNRKHNLMIALGKDVSGTSWIYDITKMPHLLVAGATNSGKSVCLNTIIISLLYQNNPEDLRFIMVDPKRVELPAYNGIPHLLVPVITDVSKTINALKWCLNEMNNRYDILNKSGKKNIQSYNADGKDKLPYIVFVIDELADFMMTAGKEMEAAIIRLAQMSRAVGIHLILATQRPSVDVITGLIKANIPARIAFSVTSMVDSKTILDMSGAEKLLGQGDMLLSTSDLSKPKRIQGAYVSDDEINDVINYIKEKSGEPEYLDGVTDRQKVGGVAGVGMDGNHGDEDELMEQAKDIIIAAGRASTSLLQRRLSIGYGRAAKILDMLEENGFIGPSNGSKPREVLVSKEQYENSGAISGMPVHSRADSKAPAAYLDEDVSDELHFTDDKYEEEEVIEEVEEETPDFLLDDNGPEDEIETEEEILEEIKEDVAEIKKDKPEDRKPRPLDDDDDYFAR